jgi:hypothetical protein
MDLLWDPGKTPLELHSLLKTLGEEYPVKESSGKSNISFSFLKSEENQLKVSRQEGAWHVEYTRPTLAARGLAYALSGQECCETPYFNTFGILFDCTRGNVVTVSRFKAWLRRLAMMGYNMAMIYVKDAYQLPDEPYFGYMRGAYSMEEIREVDAYAQSLGIEMIASIQALGHVEPVLRWDAYNKVKDTADVLLVDEPETYKLLKKILTFWSEALSSRRIHLGMDETQTLGRGKFLDINGYENPFLTYNRHLNKVCAICDELDLKPIIWSDMYFRYANKAMNYYDTSSPVPESVKKEIPSGVQLSYWDYYHRDPEIYETMLTRNRELNGKMPFMASGVWTWYRNWTDYEYTFNTVRPCIEGCRRTGTRELIFTLWGDDGGYCEFNSALAGLAWAADLAGNGSECEERTAKLYEAVCGTSYNLQLLCGKLLTYTGFDEEGKVIGKVSSASMLWDDPIMGIVWNELPGTRFKDPIPAMLANYKQVREAVAPHRQDHAAGDLNYAWCLADVLVKKIELRTALLKGYSEKDTALLAQLARHDIPELVKAIEGFADAFRTQWKRSFKPYGLELMQIRLGGLSERCRELARLLEEFLAGSVDSIPELEVKHQPLGHVPHQYFRCVTGCFFV